MKRNFLLLLVALLASAGLFASETITLTTGATLEIFQAEAAKAAGEDGTVEADQAADQVLEPSLADAQPDDPSAGSAEGGDA